MECPGSPADPGQAPAPQPGKWALVRSLNQALKTFAVMPVRTGPGVEGAPGRLGLGFPVGQKPVGMQELGVPGRGGGCC